MTRATITRSLRIIAPTTLPPPGYAKALPNPTGYQDVRPAGVTQDGFRYSLFGSYGSGCFNPYYSAKGAFILACSGGHLHPTFFGAVVFDFDTESWSYLPCANTGLMADAGGAVPGLDEGGAAPYDPNVPCWGSSKSPYWEMLCVTEGQVPSPPHPYKSQVVLAPSDGGSAKGSMLYVTRYSCNAIGGAYSGAVHAFDLVTRKWSRLSVDGSFGRAAVAEGDIVFDPVERRYHLLHTAHHNYLREEWWNPANGQFELGPNYPMYINDAGGGGLAGFIREGGGVRALIMARRDSQTGGLALAAMDLGNQAAGWTRRLSLTGEASTAHNASWVYHPQRDVYYRRSRSGAGQSLDRLIPPSGNPLTGTWVKDTVTLQGDTIPEAVGLPLTDSSGYRSLMYIPALQMLGWVTAQGVALLNP